VPRLHSRPSSSLLRSGLDKRALPTDLSLKRHCTAPERFGNPNMMQLNNALKDFSKAMELLAKLEEKLHY
jgi:hypothetical protein